MFADPASPIQHVKSPIVIACEGGIVTMGAAVRCAEDEGKAAMRKLNEKGCQKRRPQSLLLHRWGIKAMNSI